MKLSVVCLVALILVVAPAMAATVKPKPWQWPATKVVTKLKVSSPIVGGDVGSDVLSATCRGTGKHVASRYSRFVCETKWGGPNGSYTSTLTLRVLAIGSGKLCVLTTPDYKVIPWTPGTQGTRIRPERACP